MVVSPRLSRTLGYRTRPGSFRDELRGSEPSRYSITSASAARPLTLLKADEAIPSISTTNE